VRDTLAVMIPLLAAAAGCLPLSTPFVAFAAQSVALQDVRGPYTLRFAVLLLMTAVLAGAAQLGEWSSTSTIAAVLAAGVVALLGGCWRLIIPDYGTSLAISSTLLFVLSVNMPASGTALGHHALGALAGGLWAVALQVAYWPVRPQHPLRRAVADSWVAVADLFAALQAGDTATRRQRLDQAEAALRTTLDQAYAALAAKTRGRQTALHARLAELNLAAARLSTRVVALETALEPVLAAPESAGLGEALQPLFTALTNTSRSIAVTLVSRRAAHLATCEVRIDRLRNLIELFQTETTSRLPAADGTRAQFGALLQQIAGFLPETQKALRGTVDPAEERAAFSLELLDLQTWTLRPLASALVLNRRPDRVLVRFTLRVTLLTMAGVAFFLQAGLPHGYWLPLTMVIVLQPDYGATRLRASQRALGTLAGSVVASALLWLQLPPPVLMLATAATIFGFAYYLKQHYARAVFFVTLMVVLLTEAHNPVTLAFTLERLGSTVAGAVLALLGSLYLLPVWEQDRLPRILANAIEANRTYLALIAERFATAGAYDATVIAAKRRIEAANAAVFQSLQRFRADPAHQQARLQQAAALANGNQRVTRSLTVIALQLDAAARPQIPELAAFATAAEQILAGFSAALSTSMSPKALATETRQLAESVAMLASTHAPARQTREQAVLAQLPRLATEFGAMRLALQHGFMEPP
jgi:uncharacterized membrane protein YccC